MLVRDSNLDQQCGEHTPLQVEIISGHNLEHYYADILYIDHYYLLQTDIRLFYYSNILAISCLACISFWSLFRGFHILHNVFNLSIWLRHYLHFLEQILRYHEIYISPIFKTLVWISFNYTSLGAHNSIQVGHSQC